jgi:hypothetical protein
VFSVFGLYIKLTNWSFEARVNSQEQDMSKRLRAGNRWLIFWKHYSQWDMVLERLGKSLDWPVVERV